MRRALSILVTATALGTLGCETYRVEYHTRPSYYQAAGMERDETVTLDDGTVLVFSSRELSGSPVAVAAGDVDDRPRFQIRDELDDGTIVLRSLLPQHVLANTLNCLRNQEYELIWEQLLAPRTRRNYELREQGYDQFEAFFAANRMEIAATLTRMMLGLSRGEAYMENVDGGIVRFYFSPRVAPAFKFKTVEVISEGGGLKLLIIR